MFASTRRPRRRAVSSSALLVASILCIGAIGCGSGDETAPSEKAPTASANADRQDAAGAAEKPGAGARPDGSGQGKPTGANGGVDDDGGGDGREKPVRPQAAAGDEPRAPGRGSGPQGARAIERVAAKHCPKGLDLAQCKDLIKGAEQTKDTPSYPIAEPGDCVQAMSQEECEATYTAQKAAAEAAGEGVTYEECLRTPTPRCEAILRPILEQQQQAASQGAEK